MQTPVATEATTSAIAELADRAGLKTIHMLAWRDLDDDEAGGSEVHAHNVASIWTQSGLEVTMRTSAARGRPAEATREGYRVSRRAGRFSVFPRSAVAELTGRLGNCDGLVEIWNGMPFGSPIWWRGPRSIWLHHVHGPMWDMTLPAPAARVGHLIEERLAPRFYRHQPIITLSESSKREIVDDLGFDEQKVRIVHPGVDPYFTPGGDRSPTPLAVGVGRLVPVKDFPRLVRIMTEAKRVIADLRLVIVGEGYERDNIEAQIATCNAQDWIRLAGRITDEELRDLYRQAWLVASASIREGWGMTLTEAAACGTPSVATDIAGHSDAISADRSGILRSSDSDLAAAVVEVMSDERRRSELQEGALHRAGELTWENTAIATFDALAQDAIARRARQAR